jgi:hypothetical protein
MENQWTSPFLMGKSTISTGPCSIAIYYMLIYQRVAWIVSKIWWPKMRPSIEIWFQDVSRCFKTRMANRLWGERETAFRPDSPGWKWGGDGIGGDWEMWGPPGPQGYPINPYHSYQPARIHCDNWCSRL